MKTYEFMVVVLMLFFTNDIIAQEHPTEKMKTTTVKNLSIEKNGEVIPYKIKILENRKFALRFEKEDKGKLNQDRVETPAYVTKLIFVDSDKDPNYDRYIVLRYEKFPNDSFELIPTKLGFAVKVDDKHLKYIMGEGVYYLDNRDKDFFVIEEFSLI